MPSKHPSALKRVRQTKRRTLVNRARKSRLKTQLKAFRLALQQQDVALAEQLLPKTFSIIDRAAKWGIIKKNTAARYKSRLHQRLLQLSAAQASA